MAKAKKTAAKKTPAKKRKTGKKARRAEGTEIPVKTAKTEPPAAEKGLARLEDIERLFDDVFQRRWRSLLRRDWPESIDVRGLLEDRTPSIDVVDRPKEVVVRAEVPGVEKKDLDVSIADRTLTIKGSSRSEEIEGEDDYYRREIRTGSFRRSVQLPADVSASKAKATFSDGVVELHLPKARASKRQSISVG